MHVFIKSCFNFLKNILGILNFYYKEFIMGFFKRSKKEIKEADFFDFEEIKVKSIKREREIKNEKVFSHIITNKNFKANSNNIRKNSISSKQSVVKLLSNLNAKGAKNAINYVINNSNDGYAINERGEKVSAQEVIKEWNEDFAMNSLSEKSKEAWHMTFSIKENFSQYNLKALEESVNEVMKNNFADYKFISVIHTHQNNPHIHIILNKNNLFTRKKLHFNTREEIKNLFTNLREEFTNALNFHGLSYHNHSKLENDLERDKIRLEKFNYESHEDLSLFYARIQEKLIKDLEKGDKNLNSFQEKRQEIFAKKKEILTKINELKQQKPLPKSIFALFKEIKSINADLSVLALKIKKEKEKISQLKELSKENTKLRFKINNEKKDILERKKMYLNFLKQKEHRKLLSKKDLLTMKELEKDIILHESKINELVLKNIQASLLVSKLLGKKNNGFELLNSHKELDYNLNALSKVNADKETYEDYKNKLENNKKFILTLIKDRFLSLDKLLTQKLRDNKEIKPYDLKEYEKLFVFLGYKNENLLKTLKEKVKIEPKENKTKTKAAQKENIQKQSQEKEQKDLKINENPIKENLQIQEIKESSKEPIKTKKEKITQSSLLDESTQRAFITWYIGKRQITNVKIYEDLFLKQMQKNELKDFQNLYNEFLQEKSQQKSGGKGGMR